MASGPQIGAPAPEFTLPGGALVGAEFDRRDYFRDNATGRALVLAFYPGDNTTVCTRQLCSYSSGLEVFEGLNADVWGISPQGVDSHEHFARARDLRMPLLSDPDRAVARKYGVAAPGIGVRRSVFLIGPDGVLRWKHVALIGATYQSVDKLAEQLAGIEVA